jgi:hypothetical protein
VTARCGGGYSCGMPSPRCLCHGAANAEDSGVERQPVDPPEGGAGVGRPTPATVRLSDVTAERVDWLWPGYMPAGKLVVLDGDPSLGKSTIALDLAARLTTGTAWPDGAPATGGTAVIMSAEDGLADTIRPRLDAAGADPTRVTALTGLSFAGPAGGYVRPVTLDDLGPVEQVVTDTGARLVVVDVLTAYLPAGTDSHRDADVRRVLAPLADLAGRTRCCVLLLRHLNKSGRGSAIYRGGGSIGIVGAARAGFVVALDPDDPDGARRVLAPVKCNLGPTPAPLAYRLAGAENGAGRVEWLGPTSHRTDDLLAAPEGEDRAELDEAAAWLRDYLEACGGEAKAANVLRAGRADGFAERRLQRARQRAGVAKAKAGFAGGWLWRLDAAEGDAKAPKATPAENLSSSSPSRAAVSPSAGAAGRQPAGPPTCRACRQLLDPTLNAAGETTHPNCDPEAAA